ncbi:GDSL-type esterase/lipase family protein [Limnoglobus roseus]|uniref:Putative carbohydrate esterase n=1 Tax=Limnoglobus roseus TaxID=2598579 RepID=A0A5C1AFD1_9BACT|nr:GDSL-type esterase/lipase family protein [Limnoglobus roseus]QEL17275.1 putative carbohydrate esterase [Limnoglobus roseus]
MFAFHRRPALALFAAAVSLLTLRTSGLAQDSPAKPNDAVKPVPRDANWMKRHQSFLDRAKKGPVDVLFVGDSITQGWEGNGKKVWAEKFEKWTPANFGIGGDRTQHVLWRITEGKELDGVDPKVIVMMIGTNNFSSNTPDEVAAGVKAILDEFHKQKPKAKVLLLGVFPRSAKPGKELNEKGVTMVAKDELQPKTKLVNDLLAKFDDGKAVKYLDIGDKFLDDKGGLAKKTMPDFLHLSEPAYAIWADAIAKPVEELLKK